MRHRRRPQGQAPGRGGANDRPAQLQNPTLLSDGTAEVTPGQEGAGQDETGEALGTKTKLALGPSFDFSAPEATLQEVAVTPVLGGFVGDEVDSLTGNVLPDA